MKVLVDEMCPATVAEALRAARIEATTVASLRLAGATDPEVFGAESPAHTPCSRKTSATSRESLPSTAPPEVTTTDCSFPLPSRFSRRPAGLRPLLAAVQAVAGEQIEDRVIYLERVESE